MTGVGDVAQFGSIHSATLADVAIAVSKVSSWYGSSFIRGELIARAAVMKTSGRLQLEREWDALVVVDAASGERVAALAFPSLEAGTCCRVIDWLDDRSVAFLALRRGTYGIFAWNITTGEVRRVTEFDQGVDASLATDAIVG